MRFDSGPYVRILQGGALLSHYPKPSATERQSIVDRWFVDCSKANFLRFSLRLVEWSQLDVLPETVSISRLCDRSEIDLFAGGPVQGYRQ